MKRKLSASKLFMSIAIFSMLALTTLGSLTYAWIAGSGTVPSDLLSGSILTQYFHCGDGSEENPFVITRPIHFYNMTYLYQRKEGFADAGYHFQIGYDLDGQGGLEVYSYANDGSIIDGQYVTVLNMNYYQDGSNKGGALLPIGTSSTPFNGTFDGSELTISNIHIKSQETIGDTTYKTSDVGIFGYVNSDAVIKDAYFKDVSISLVDADANESCDSGENAHDQDKDGTNIVYVGYIAGHTKIGASVSNVYVNNSTIQGGSEAFSGYGYFGCVEDKSGNVVTQLGTAVATIRGEGTGAGFGGSLDMTALYNRIYQVINNNTTGGVSRTTTYPTSETLTAPGDSNSKPEVTIESTATLASDYASNNFTRYYWSTASADTYIGTFASGNGYKGNFLSGLSSTTEVTTYSKTGEEVTAYYISNGDYYFSVNGTTISNDVKKESSATKWLVDSNKHWYTYVNNTVYYLNYDSNKNLQISNIQANKAPTWNQESDGSFSTTISGTKYYLIYSGSEGWHLVSVLSSSVIKDEKDNYLSINTSSVSNTTNELSATRFYVENKNSNYYFSTSISGTTYYLTTDGSTLSLSTSQTSWLKDGVGYYREFFSTKYYLTYSNGWKVLSNIQWSISSNGRYLNASGTTLSVSNSSETKWIYSNNNIYYVYNGAQYYLNYADKYKLELSTSNTTTWTKENNSYYYTVNGVKCYLQFTNNGFAALPENYYVISDGSGNYLKANGGNSYTNTTTESDATHFYFENMSNKSGSIAYSFNGNTYYIGNNAGKFSNTSSSWSNDGSGRLYINGTNYYIGYSSSTWQILNCPDTYIIGDGKGNYIGVNSSYSSLTTVTSKDEAAKWTFSTTGTYPQGTISIKNGTNTYYIRVNRTQSGGCPGNYTYTYSLGFDTSTSNNSWTNNNGVLKNSSYTDQYLVCSSGSWTVSTTSATLTFEAYKNLDGTSLTISDGNSRYDTSISSTDNEINGVETMTTYESSNTTFTETTETKYASVTETYRRGTYIPLKVSTEGDEDYDSNYTYAVSQTNTGYIIGGAYSDSQSNGQGDIRVAGFSISNISNSYSNGTFSNIYTFNGSGSPVKVTASNYSQYESVKGKFKDILAKDPSYVYGLHFMNSQISTSHVIQAESATIMGTTYMNYDLPESSIDFNIIERGYITFMAGDYYSGNNAFFSLNQVFRDANGKITSIKQINKIYVKSGENASLSPYIYEYSDGSLSEGTSIPSNYELKFNCEWIMNPTNGTSSFSNKYIYYFEIPCNVGEYALGSVSGKTGAYLLYLDIGSSGGSMLESTISSEGNELVDSFNVEYRYADDETQPDSTIIQMQVNAPEATADTFSITVEFCEDDDGDGMSSKGCYHITIVNKTSSNVNVCVFLCDDDDDPKNTFDYAFKITYINNSHEEGVTIERDLGSVKTKYWKAVAGFVIPPSGNASEQSYQG